MSDLGFRGEVAELYHRYRHGYPAETIDAIVRAFDLGAPDAVIDLGCGTGQLTLPVARRVGLVLGLDPEVDMLDQARAAAIGADVANVAWMVAGDTDLPLAAQQLGRHRLGAITIGQALHWMQVETLFRAALPPLKPGGGIAVTSNGTPLWLHDTDWSLAVHEFLETWLGTSLGATCGTDDRSRETYRQQLTAAGLTVSEHVVTYVDDLTIDQLIGGVLSAISVDRLPVGERRNTFIDGLTQAVPTQAHYRESVRVCTLLACKPR